MARWTYDCLKDEVLGSKLTYIQWCMNEELMSCKRVCGHCNKKMNLVECKDRSVGRRTEISIQQGSGFDKSRFVTTSLFNIVSNTAVDWDSFCHETCEVTLSEPEEKIGGPSKIVQINERKFGKRKYDRGHCVEGQ